MRLRNFTELAKNDLVVALYQKPGASGFTEGSSKRISKERKEPADARAYDHFRRDMVTEAKQLIYQRTSRSV